MRQATYISALILLLLSAKPGHGAPFQNLDFESGVFVYVPGGFPDDIDFAQAFPGWRGYVGGIQGPTTLSNAIALSFSTMTLFDAPSVVIDGKLSAGLQATARFDQQPADMAIAQTGLVPLQAQSLLFRAQTYGEGFDVRLGGQPLSLVPLLTTPDYVLFGADITSWAGQESELRFTADAGSVPGRSGTQLILDSIEFSASPIPEPSTLALFGAGAILVFLYWRRKAR